MKRQRIAAFFIYGQGKINDIYDPLPCDSFLFFEIGVAAYG